MKGREKAFDRRFDGFVRLRARDHFHFFERPLGPAHHDRRHRRNTKVYRLAFILDYALTVRSLIECRTHRFPVQPCSRSNYDQRIKTIDIPAVHEERFEDARCTSSNRPFARANSASSKARRLRG